MLLAFTPFYVYIVVYMHPPRPGLLRRSQAAKKLGVKREHLYWLEKRGQIQPVMTEGNVQYFDPGQVEALRKARLNQPGIPRGKAKLKTYREARSMAESEALALEMFSQGYELPQIVAACRISCERVRKLWLQYKTPLSATTDDKAAAEAVRESRRREKEDFRREAYAKRLEIEKLRAETAAKMVAAGISPTTHGESPLQLPRRPYERR